MGSTVTCPEGRDHRPESARPPHLPLREHLVLRGSGPAGGYIKKRKFNGDIALRYLIWYGAGRFWIEALRTDSLLLVPSLGLRAVPAGGGAAVVGGVALEIS